MTKAIEVPVGAIRVAPTKPAARPAVCRLLPLPARELLVEAAFSATIGRSARINEATQVVKQKYPQFFK